MPPKKEVPQPKLVEAVVSYSAGVKASIAKFENADLHVSQTERWNVEGLSEELVEAFVADRYEVLKERVDEKVTEFYTENSENC